MTRQLETINLQGKEYAQVSERIKQFREDFPNSKIITKTSIATDMDSQDFSAYIWRDRKDYISGDLDSADSTGTARGSLQKEKDFEKLETIAVGRALALLGYLASGEIASFEEMEEFYAKKESDRKSYIQEQVDLFDTVKTMDQLKGYWATTNKIEPAILAAKDKRKAELESKSARANKPPVKEDPIKATAKKIVKELIEEDKNANK